MPKSLEFPSRLAFNSKSSKVVSFRRKAFERYFLCGNQPLVWGVPTKLQNSLSQSNRSRFG